MEVLIKTTGDQSHTLYVPALNEHYHSVHGAWQESDWVFIKNGIELLKHCKNIRVLEIGFGTGLNAFQTMLWAEKNQVKVEYHSLETLILDRQLLQNLNYKNFAHAETQTYEKICMATWNHLELLSPYFSLKKIHQSLFTYSNSTAFDIIFFDAFAPEKQAEMWTQQVFENLYSFLKADGRLLTYCAKGAVKRTLKACGFLVLALPGPPGKREMTMALKAE